MRNVIKAFLIAGIVLNVGLMLSQSVTCIIDLNEVRDAITFIKIITTVMFSVGIILCAVSLTCLDTYNTGLTVAVILLGNIVAGILMFIYKDEMRKKYIEQRNKQIEIENEEIRRKNVENKHDNPFFDNVQTSKRMGMPASNNEKTE